MFEVLCGGDRVRVRLGAGVPRGWRDYKKFPFLDSFRFIPVEHNRFQNLIIYEAICYVFMLRVSARENHTVQDY